LQICTQDGHIDYESIKLTMIFELKITK